LLAAVPVWSTSHITSTTGFSPATIPVISNLTLLSKGLGAGKDLPLSERGMMHKHKPTHWAQSD
jgi:hypothetical protein